MTRRVWISDSENEGSTCDAGTGHHFDNVDGFTAMQQCRTAEGEGEEVVWMDKSIYGLGDETRAELDEVRPTDHYDIYRSEEDGQGVDMPRLYNPGR